MYEKFIRDMLLVYLQKNRDYGDSFVDSMKIYGKLAGQVRILDKVNRINSLLTKNNPLVNESIKDTVLDLFNYLVMYNCATSKENSIIDILEEMMYIAEHNDTFAEQVNIVLEKATGFNEENCKSVNGLLWGYIVSFT